MTGLPVCTLGLIDFSPDGRPAASWPRGKPFSKMEHMNQQTIILKRQRADGGGIEIKELSRGMFSDDDAFQEAVDDAYMLGFVESN